MRTTISASANQKVKRGYREPELAQKQLGPAEARLAAAQQSATGQASAVAATEKTMADSKAALVAVQAEVAKIEEEVAQIRGSRSAHLLESSTQLAASSRRSRSSWTQRIRPNSLNASLRCEGSRVAIATLSNNSRLRRSRCRRS